MNKINHTQPVALWHGQTRDELARKVDTRRQMQELPSSDVEAALSDMQDVALQDTMEDMSLVLGNRLRGKSQRTLGSGNDELIERDEQLALLAEQVAGDKLDAVLENLKSGGNDDIFTLFRQGELSFSDAALLLAAEMNGLAPGSKRRKRLSEQLDELLAGKEDWALEMFAELELGSVDSETMHSMQRIIRQHHRHDREGNSPEGIWQWFNTIKEWSDRSKRIRVLIHTFAFELSTGESGLVGPRLVAALFDLKKLLIFMGMEDIARGLAKIVGLSEDQALSEILLMIEQRWMYPEWLANRITYLNIKMNKRVLYLIKLCDVLKFLPEICFLDVQQRNQLVEATEEYIYQLSQ
ncbi:TyeA family type III secretion system gatekeeper subunit [unidentified bacterial endosymbiont]|uniref:TyeA family type III secretion system gatekeeper subunit n=1 Tax=unidentified bacterial endosymbiont TaxID=2355 RepID=UPI00209DE774|nr:TyeA family type III secretion system gatekeeper subunit [unidentified bacterial endosymbiont]